MTIGLALVLFLAMPISVSASSVSELQEQIDELEKEKDKIKQEQTGNRQQLANTKGKINNLTGAMDTLDAEIEGLDMEMVGLLTDISIIEQAIEEKRAQIQETQEELEQAIATQNEQYETMKIRIRYMYEQGEKSYVTLLLESHSIEDALNKADYIEKLYAYDRKLLLAYQETVKQVQALKETLEEEESELVTSEHELKQQQELLEDLLAEKKQEYEDYDARLVRAKQEAAVFTAKINQQINEIRAIEAKEKEKKAKQEEIKRQEEEKKRKEEEERKAKEAQESKTAQTSYEAEESDSSFSGGSTTTSGEKTTSSAPKPSSVSGSSKGEQIANYASQFLGNPYVPGGTSLTNGADCSGFTMTVYQQFGINLPRTSYAQSQVGTAVSYDQAKAGDLVYYGGHVGIYRGDGTIVHASTQKTGIKISNVTYRPIITIRRVVK